MGATIINRGRGPEIAGTRITVYRIMDYVVEGEPAEVIAADLELDIKQVQAALDYIAAHRAEVDAEYAKIMARIAKGNPPWVNELLANSAGELRDRIVKLESEVARNEALRP